MGILEAVFAVLGVLFLVLVLYAKFQPPPVEDDLAAPYREGLHAAVRMQKIAQDLEQQIYAEAAYHLDQQVEDTERP